MPEPKTIIIDGQSVTLYPHKRGWSLDPVSAERDNDRLDAVVIAFKISWHNQSHTNDLMDKVIGIDSDYRFGAS